MTDNELRNETDQKLLNSILIYSVITSLMDENLNIFLGLLVAPKGVFSPTRSLDERLLSYLFSRNLIYKYEPIYDLVCRDKSDLFLYAGAVQVLLPCRLDNYSKYAELLKLDILNYSFDGADYLIEGLVVDVSVNECVRFLELTSKKYQIDIYIGKKSEMILKNALVYYNVGQIISLLWSCVKSILVRKNSGNYKIGHSVNSVMDCFERLLVRAKNENWSVTCYKRLFDIPQCRISRVLFEDILKVDDDGYGFSLGWYKQQICEISLKV